MGRRSDHTREELRELLIATGHALLTEVGLARFSGREVAKRAGYTAGTIYNVFGSLDSLIAAINSRTFSQWAAYLRGRLDAAGDDRIGALVEGYFGYALSQPLAWSAIYDHQPAPEVELSADDLDRRAELTAIVEHEVRAALPPGNHVDVPRYARSLIATVHGHCSYVVSGTFALDGEIDPVGSALARVRESLSVQK